MTNRAWTDLLTIDVVDTGPGIDHVHTSTLFDAFVLAPRPGNRSAGLGLGLHICQGLANLMGGDITYAPRDAPLTGSCFHVELPLPMATMHALPVVPATVTEPGLKILLVEDDEIAREATAALLQSFGHDATATSGAEEAIALIKTSEFDLVLMDIQLHPKGMSGLDTVRAIRALPSPARETTIIALTGDGLVDNHAHYFAGGINGVLVKPLTIKTGLAELVAAARETTLGENLTGLT